MSNDLKSLDNLWGLHGLVDTPFLMHLNHYGVIQVEGIDAKSFLHGQLTLNMDSITEHSSTLGGYCNLKGRLHAIFYLTQRSDFYWLIMPKSIIPHVLSTLKKYAMFSKVSITDESNHLEVLGALHPTDSILHYKEIAIVRVPEDRILLVGKADALSNLCQTSDQLVKTSGEVWDYLDIQYKIPSLSKETLERFLPHHLNLKNLGALNFEKGCYLGQEIIARMEYKGQIKKNLFRGTIEGDFVPNPGDELYLDSSQQPVGHVLKAMATPEKIELLMILEDKAHNQNLKITERDTIISVREE